MITPLLSVAHLSKSYMTGNSALPVLKDIHLQVKKGEFVCILGPSGCGKSTLFHILAGIEKEDSGQIILNNINLQDRRGSFGYMFQSDLLLPWRSALENIRLPLEIKGMDKKSAQKRASFLLKEFQLDRFADFYPASLSGGMKQRIALLRTIAFDCPILLLDEPFGSLDALTRLSMQLYLLCLWRKLGLTILFVTHDIREAIFLSDRIYVMDGAPAQIVKILKVSLPRPRSARVLAAEGAVSLESKLIRLLINDKL